MNIKDLFDYQNYAGNANLSEIIANTGSRYGIFNSQGIELDDEELMLNAAGEPNIAEESSNKIL